MVMISINVFRKKSILYFVFCFIRWSKGNTFLFVVTGTLPQPISKSQKLSHTLDLLLTC